MRQALLGMKAEVRVALVLMGLLCLPGLSKAVQPDEILPNAALEQRARTISGGLRCLVCQNQSIDESDAPLARDLRILVRERLVSGDSDQGVRDFVVARYGEFVLLSPPVNPRTIGLWAAPFIILLTAFFFVWRRSQTLPAAPRDATRLSAEEEARVRTVLEQDGR